MPAAYFLGTQLLGSTIAYHKWDDTEDARFSEALFCPVCGDIWARIVESLATTWHVTNRECSKHSSRDCAGSFIAPWRTTFEELPPEVLRYEAQLRLNRLKDNP